MPVGGVEVEVDAGVHAALAEVAVERAVVAVLSSSARSRAGSRRARSGGTARVLPALPGVGLAGDVGGGAEARPRAPSRSACSLAASSNSLHRRRAPAALQRRASSCGLAVGLVLACRRRTRPAASRLPSGSSVDVRRDAGACFFMSLDEQVVDALQRRSGRSASTSGTWSAGVVDVGVAEHERATRAGGLGTRRTRRLEDVTQRPLGADQRARDVEAVLGQQLVEVVAGDAARDVRVSARGSGRRSGRAARRARVDLAAPAAGADDRAASSSSLVAPTVRRGAVVGEDLELLDVVGGARRP